MGVVVFLIPVIAGFLIARSDIENKLVKALGYLLMAVFGAGLILMLL